MARKYSLVWCRVCCAFTVLVPYSFFILKHYSSLEVLLLVSVENISMVFSLKHSNVSLWVVKR